jgi:hypothetical protein
MTAPIADLDAFPQRNLLDNQIDGRVVVPVGAAGATGTLLDGPYGIACAYTATGKYAFTGLPICPSATTARSKAVFWTQLVSPLLTVTEATITVAHSTSAGTLTVTTSKAGTAAEPASGDVLILFWKMERE